MYTHNEKYQQNDNLPVFIEFGSTLYINVELYRRTLIFHTKVIHRVVRTFGVFRIYDGGGGGG